MTPSPADAVSHSMTPDKFNSQLRAMEDCSGSRGHFVPECLQETVSPLRVCKWRSYLGQHPNQEFADVVLRGISEGFRIGYDATRVPLRQKHNNMLSALEHPEVVTEYVAAESAAHRFICVGDVETARSMGIHCSPFGVIPKKNRPNKWRLIINLSAPEGYSVNDGIERELASVSYTSIDDIISKILQLGQGSLLAKMDIKQAYRNVPVHPEDRPLLGMLWEGKVYVDTALPFGLRSAPLIFSAVANALLWIMKQKGVTYADNYIDDFITVGAPNSSECQDNCRLMHETCDEVGLPTEPDKDEGPATTISFLGLEVDSVALQLRLPAEKLGRLKTELEKWRQRKACRKRELLSLIGLLSHACKAVRAGRSFLRRLIDLSTVARHLDHFVRISRDARSDIEWWFHFCSAWNGVSMMRSAASTHFSAEVTSDASGSWGCGAFSGSSWFQLKWSTSYVDSHISAKELVPIVIAAVVWGEGWRGKSIQVWCDNVATVSTINQGSSANRDVMHLARCLAFIKAKFEFELMATHLPGAKNSIADALSRNKMTSFRSLLPQADQEPTRVPDSLLDLLIISRPDWTSRLWTDLWSSTFKTV